MKEKAQGALEYLLLIGGAILISAVAIMALTAAGIGAPSNAQNLYNERYNALYHKSAEGGGTPSGCSTSAECNDSNPCTTDTCASGTCSHTQITACSMTSDGCCPTSCNTGNDADCTASCGNGIPETGENCTNCSADIPCTGELCCSDVCTPIACSTNADCDDSNPNTTDVCNSPGTCQANCSHTLNDTTPPTTSYGDSFIDGVWDVLDVAVVLTCTDDVGGTGCNKVFYRLEGTGDYTEVVGSTASFSVITEGSHLLEYYSIDNSANTETTKSAHINIDKTNPTVSITSPTAGSIVKGTITITASASDSVPGSGINYVSFNIGGAPKGNDNAAPYSFDWVTPGVSPNNYPDGTYSLTATAYDNVSNSSASSAVQVTLDNTAPNKPSTPTATVGNAQVTLTYSATDPAPSSGIKEYDIHRSTTSGFTAGSANRITTTPLTTYTNTGLTNGTTYYYRVIARDNALNNSVQSDQRSAIPTYCGDTFCVSGETYSSCAQDCCEADCTSKSDTICHLACDTKNGCTLYSGADGKALNSVLACYNTTQYYSACKGEIKTCLSGYECSSGPPAVCAPV